MTGDVHGTVIFYSKLHCIFKRKWKIEITLPHTIEVPGKGCFALGWIKYLEIEIGQNKLDPM